jgi:hypothetical protein
MFDAAKKVLVEGFFPIVPTHRLNAMLKLLEADDPAIIQGSTSFPPPLLATDGEQVESVDPVGFMGSDNTLTLTVGEVEEGFARLCFDADQRLGEPAACRFLLNAIDDNDRTEVWDFLTAEIRQELSRRLLRDKAVTKLRPDLQDAVRTFPTDTTLWGACIDSLLEEGLEDEAEALRYWNSK